MVPDSASPYFKVYKQQTLQCSTRLDMRLEIGRQQPGEPPPFYFDQAAQRLIVAAKDNKRFSRKHLLVEQIDAPEAEGSSANQPTLRLSNLSQKRSVTVGSDILRPQDAMEVTTPVLLLMEGLAFRIECEEEVEWRYSQLGHRTLPPHLSSRSSNNLVATIGQMLTIGGAPDSGADPKLARWLAEAMDLLRSAAGADDYYEQAVRSIARIVQLDLSIALGRSASRWEVLAKHSVPSDFDAGLSQIPSETILEKVLETRSTFCQLPNASAPTASLAGVSALVASPILNAQGEVVGALYGVRYQSDESTLPQISDLEATMVEVIACGTAAGIARKEEQQKAIAARVQFEQFFSPALARELETNPTWLEGRECEVSILFCDVVRFSAISGRIGPRLTSEWIGSVMDVLSETVFRYEGVVVDYIGDELMAMWGAPKSQADHRELAARAAVAMHASAQRLDRQWIEKVGGKLHFRIGICSGLVIVGNTGSKHKFKYGPLGETVNVASRLQSAAKYFGARTLLSESSRPASCEVTPDQKEDWQVRDIGDVHLVNIEDSIRVYELMQRNARTAQICNESDAINTQIRNGDLVTADAALARAIRAFPDDVYFSLLQSRVQHVLAEVENAADTCRQSGTDELLHWKLDSK